MQPTWTQVLLAYQTVIHIPGLMRRWHNEQSVLFTHRVRRNAEFTAHLLQPQTLKSSDHSEGFYGL